MKRFCLISGLFLCLGGISQGQAPPAAPAPQQTQIPQVLVTRANVRRFSAGITFTVNPTAYLSSERLGRTEVGPPAVEFRTNVDPNTRLFGYGAIVQFTVTERLAIAVNPTVKTVKAHTVYDKLVGVDNSSTSFDDREKTSVDENISARHIDVPILLRLYNKGHHENGARWFFEVGPVVRLTSKSRVERKVFPPNDPGYTENVVFPFRKNSYGVTAGIGGQFIDDFGIRAIPEVRFTRFLTRAYDSIEGRTRLNQIEVLLTFSF